MPGITKKQALLYLQLPFNTDVRKASKEYQLRIKPYHLRYPLKNMTWSQLRQEIGNLVLTLTIDFGEHYGQRCYEQNENGQIVPTQENIEHIASLDPVIHKMPRVVFFYNIFSENKKVLKYPLPSDRVVVLGVRITCVACWEVNIVNERNEVIGEEKKELNIDQDFNMRYDAFQIMTWPKSVGVQELAWEEEIRDDVARRYKVDAYIITIKDWNCQYRFEQEVVPKYDIREVPLRFTYLSLSNAASRHWDSNTGLCVIDYLHYKFGKTRGVIKKMSIDNLKIELQKLAGNHNIMEGVSSNTLLEFCRQNQISAHVLDVCDNKIDQFIAERNSKMGAIVFKIQGDHIHPYEDNLLIKQISQKKIYQYEDKDFSRLYFDSKVKKNDFTKEMNIEFVEDREYPDVFDYREVAFGYRARDKLVGEIITRKEIPSPHWNIRHYQGEVQYIKFSNDTIVYIDDKKTAAKDVMDYYKWQRKHWANDTIFSELKKILQDYNIRYSYMGFSSLAFISKYRTERIHQGYYNKGCYGYINDDDDDTHPYIYSDMDVNKCYRYCAEESQFRWCFTEIDSQFEPFNESENIRDDHMYEVYTSDTRLCKGDGIYTYPKIIFGLERGIIQKGDIVKKIRCSTKEEDYLKKLFQKIHDYIDDDYPEAPKLRKKMINVMIGIFGASEKQRQMMFATPSQNDVLHYEKNYTKEFKIDKYEVQGLQLVSTRSKYKMLRNNIPLNMQVIDLSNILLYQMQEQIDMVPHTRTVYKYVDCLYIQHRKGTTLSIENMGPDPGQYRTEKTYERSEFLKKIDGMCRMVDGPNRNEFPTYEEEECQLSRNIFLEEDRRKTIAYVRTLLYNNVSFMVYGKAGTGKTYLLENTIKPMLNSYDKFNYAVLSFTNVACGLIDGMTLHSFFAIKDDKNQLHQANIERFKSLNYIIVDEISMVPKQFWCIFYQLKMQAGCSFIFLGDYRQCPPPEYTTVSMLETDTCTRIIDKNIVELTESKRYEKKDKLYSFLDQIWTQKLSLQAIREQMTKIDYIDETFYHICYTNKTRRKINTKINNKISTYTEIMKNVEMYKYEVKIFDNQTETRYEYVDVRLYVGQELISRTNSKKYNAFNNEVFTITEIKDKTVSLETQRKKTKDELNSDDKEQKLQKFRQHQITMQKQELFSQFELAYCLTVYKWQGKTIPLEKYVTIHDLGYLMIDKRFLYTALSRVKKFKQLYLYESE